MNSNAKILTSIDEIIKDRRVNSNANFLIGNILAIKNLQDNQKKYARGKIKQFLANSGNWNRSLEKCHFLTMLVYELADYECATAMLKTEIVRRQTLEQKLEIFWYLAQSAFLSKNLDIKINVHEAFRHVIEQFGPLEIYDGKSNIVNNGLLSELDVLVVTHQFLSLSHAPTLDALNYCKALIQLGKKVELLVTNEMPHTPQIFWSSKFNINNELLGRKRIEYQGISVIVNALRENVTQENIEKTVASYASRAPKLVLLIGNYSIYAELLGVAAPLVTLPCSTDYCYSKYSKVLMWFGGDNKKAEEFASNYNLRSQKIVTHLSYQYNSPVEKQKVDKSDLGIQDHELVGVVVGNRLDQEIDDAFIDFLGDLNSARPHVMLIVGSMSPNTKKRIGLRLPSRVIYIDFHENLYDLYGAVDFYINPRRSGGGTSAAYALAAGVPVFSIDFGDVSKIALPEFCFSTYQEMLSIKNLIGISNFKEFYGEDAKRKFVAISDKKIILNQIMHLLQADECL
jgi:hypothetical protein